MELRTAAFFTENDNEWETVGEGVKRQITGYDVSLMTLKVAFDKGSIGVIHQHYHSQTSYVAWGVFEVSVNGQKQVLKAGDAFYAAPNIWHGVVCLEAGLLIDSFSPVREDFLK